MENQLLVREWESLQVQSDRFELGALAIKLFAVALCVIFLVFQPATAIIVIVPFILWFQEAIWKTYQGRTEARLLVLEKAIADNLQTDGSASSAIAFQFNQEFAASRGGLANLICEYFSQALRPTIAYPHLLLVALTGYVAIF